MTPLYSLSARNAACGTTSIYNVSLLGLILLCLAIFVFIKWRRKRQTGLLLLFVVFLVGGLLTVLRYEYYSCLPSGGGKDYTRATFQLLPKGQSIYINKSNPAL